VGGCKQIVFVYPWIFCRHYIGSVFANSVTGIATHPTIVFGTGQMYRCSLPSFWLVWGQRQQGRIIGSGGTSGFRRTNGVRKCLDSTPYGPSRLALGRVPNSPCGGFFCFFVFFHSNIHQYKRSGGRASGGSRSIGTNGVRFTC
jgi:hypothetical protein